MNKEDAAKIFAIKYELDYNTFRRSERLKDDLVWIRTMFMGDEEFDSLFERYCEALRQHRNDLPRWAKLIMAERYSLNV